MTELSTTGLLEKTAELNKMAEFSQVALGICLARVKETEAYKGQYETFDQYYRQELNRSKGDISKLLKVGRFMLDGGFPEETEVGYTVLHTAILALPDKKPEYVLATAQTNTISEILENRRDDAFGQHPADWEPAFHCKTCGKFTTNPQNHD